MGRKESNQTNKITIFIYRLYIVTGMVDWIGDKMRVKKQIWLTFFEGALQGIGDHLEELMKKPECNGADTILMVGGFSESPLLQEYIMKRYVQLQLMKNPPLLRLCMSKKFWHVWRMCKALL